MTYTTEGINTGRILDDDDFVMYVETEEEKQKPRYIFTGNAKAALTDYYDAVHTLCEAQQNFTKSTQVLEKKITDKSVFLDIIKQVQLPSVKVEIRTVEELERMEGKTYRDLTLMCYLPNFKRINPNAKEQARTMAAYIYCVLYEQITGVRASQTGCAMDFLKTPIIEGHTRIQLCVSCYTQDMQVEKGYHILSMVSL